MLKWLRKLKKNGEANVDSTVKFYPVTDDEVDVFDVRLAIGILEPRELFLRNFYFTFGLQVNAHKTTQNKNFG